MPRRGSRGSLWWRKGVAYAIWYRNGARFCVNTHKTLEAEAQLELVRLMAACEDANQVRPEHAPPGINAMLNEVVRHYHRNEFKSAEHVERHARRLQKAFRGKRADEITRDQVTRYVDRRREEGAANATVNRELAVLNLAYSLARKGGKVKAEMVPAIAMLPEKNKRTGFFEQEHYEAVLAKLPDYMQGALTLAYWTGMRKEEVLGLTWDKVDLLARLVQLEKTKNGEDRTLPVNDELYAMFKRQESQKWDGCPFVFHLGPERIRSFRWFWTKACREAGCPDKLFHDLRRTGVRNLIRSGVPQSIAMMISGHKDARIFQRYNIVDTRDLAEAMRKVSEYEAEKRRARLGSHGFTDGEKETKKPALPTRVN